MTKAENKKYRDIIETGRDLFFRHGTKRVTVEEICQKADVSKMTFYKFFKNKNELLTTIMEEIFNKAIDDYYKIMDEDIPFIDKIRKIIRYKIERSHQYGKEFIEEMFNDNEELQKFIQEMLVKSYKLNMDFYKKGQELGAIDKSIKPDFFFAISEMSHDILNNERIAMIYPDLYERIEVFINFFFYGVVGPPKEK